MVDHRKRDPQWRRYSGDQAIVAIVPGDIPTVGVGVDICDGCAKRRVLIACISDAGHECNIGVDAATALAIADDIRQRALLISDPAGAG